jgi:hypothetical protein
MTPDICEYEDALMAALAAGHASGEIQRHLKMCETCHQAELVWRYLEQLASQEACEAPLPSASLIWWRAQLAEKRKLAARSVVAIELVQKAAIAAVAAFVIVAAVLWGRDVLGNCSLPWPVAIAALLLIAGSVAGMLYVWFQGHSMRVLARQR